VTCRVLIDAVGSRPWLKPVTRAMAAGGIEMLPMLPVRWPRLLMRRIDLRNHRKLAVIDGRIAYTGSQNIVDAGYGRKDIAWHDLMVRLTGPVVLELQVVFVADWYYESDELLEGNAYFPEPEQSGTIPVQTLPSGPSYPTQNYQRMVVAAIHAAQREVVITTPYFIPDEAFLQAIEIAVLRGVEVRVILPERSDQVVVGAASRAYYDLVLDAGAALYLYQDGLLHAKTMSIDDAFTFLGSSNFDIRSFALNFEINLVFYGAHETAILRAAQRQYIRRSKKLTREEWARRPSHAKALENIAKLFSPVL